MGGGGGKCSKEFNFSEVCVHQQSKAMTPKAVSHYREEWATTECSLEIIRMPGTG